MDLTMTIVPEMVHEYRLPAEKHFSRFLFDHTDYGPNRGGSQFGSGTSSI